MVDLIMTNSLKLVDCPGEISSLIKNLRQLALSKKISDAELCRQTKIPPATLNKILSGKTTDPRISTLQILANYFDVSLDALLHDTPVSGQKTQSIPIISWGDCIKEKKFLEELSPSNWVNWLTIEYCGPNNIYGLTSKPSMEPRFPKGTIFIVNAETKLRDGDFVVVKYKDAKEATLRKLSMDGPDILLLPVGPNASPERLSSSMSIIGVVIESRFIHYD